MPKWSKDDIESVRKLLTHPNWAMLKLLADGKPRTKKEIYAELGKKFTRKTLIISLHTLSVELGALKPVIDSRYAFADIAEAHEHMAANANAGKIVVDVS